MNFLFLILKNLYETSTLLSGGGARQSLEATTPKLINITVNELKPRAIPVVTSCRGDPFFGFIISRTTKLQQNSKEKTVTKIYPET